MAAGPVIDVSGWLHEQLAQASPDLLRAMVTTFAEALGIIAAIHAGQRGVHRMFGLTLPQGQDRQWGHDHRTGS